MTLPQTHDIPSQPVVSVLDRLEKVRRNAKGWTARCPAHIDKFPSLSISEGRDGRVLLYCFAGCEVEGITRALGLGLTDLFVEKRDPLRVVKPQRRHPVPRRVAQALLGRPSFALEWEAVKLLASLPEPVAQREVVRNWDYLSDSDLSFVVSLSRVVREARS